MYCTYYVQYFIFSVHTVPVGQGYEHSLHDDQPLLQPIERGGGVGSLVGHLLLLRHYHVLGLQQLIHRRLLRHIYMILAKLCIDEDWHPHINYG